jgi:hypothetical protein
MYTNIQQDATMVSCFITRPLYMFRALSVPIIRSTLTTVDSHWYNIRMLRWIVNFVVTSTLRGVQNRAVGHITIVELELVLTQLQLMYSFIFTCSIPLRTNYIKYDRENIQSKATTKL